MSDKEKRSVENAYFSTIYDLDEPRVADIQHSPKANFVANVLFRPLSEIISTFDLIQTIPVYIRNFPFNRQGISKMQYIQYHIGNYIVEVGNLRNRLIGYVGKIKNAYKKITPRGKTRGVIFLTRNTEMPKKRNSQRIINGIILRF